MYFCIVFDIKKVSLFTVFFAFLIVIVSVLCVFNSMFRFVEINVSFEIVNELENINLDEKNRRLHHLRTVNYEHQL